jgi:hypothetical protein
MPEIIGNTVDLITGVATANLKHANAELKTEAADLITENQELKEQIKALKEEKENSLVYNDENGLFYSADDTDNRHPFCPACYDTDKKRIHLLPSLKCPGCKADYYQFKPSDIQTRRVYTARNTLEGY